MQEAVINHPGLRERAEKLGKKNPKLWSRDQSSARGREPAELGHRLLKKSCLR